MTARVLATVLAALSSCGAAFGGDAEFDRIVQAIESHYGTHPMHIPFMGLASFVVKVAHPEGATSLKLAVFEDLKEDSTAWREVDRFMDQIPNSNLHPLVRVHSRHNGESTYVFMGPVNQSGKNTRVLIATFERHEATVVEVKADMGTLMKSLGDPEHIGDRLGARHGDRDHNRDDDN